MYSLILTNPELISTILVLILTMFKLTRWGQAKSQALDAVITAVEATRANVVKQTVASTTLPTGAQDAIVNAVAKADPNKQQESLATRLINELTRV